jgi:outer membrane immunogenic protein
MKISAMAIALAAALLSMTAAQAGEFEDFYLGGKVGYNVSSPDTNYNSNTIDPGIEAGYGWDVGNILLGVNVFADWHTKSATRKDYGVDVKLGVPMDNFMPYLKLGAVAKWPGTRLHGGLGLEYKYAPQLSVVGEWTADSMTYNGQEYKNNNFSAGLNYRIEKWPR